MVSLQSPLMAAPSALREGEEQVKNEKNGCDNVEELLVELQREKQKNAILLDRISTLEAQIHDIYYSCQGRCHTTGGSDKRLVKRQKIEATPQQLRTINEKLDNCLVSWISMDEMRSSPLDKCENIDSTLHSKEKDDTNEKDDDDPCSDHDDVNSLVKVTESCTMNDKRQINEANVHCMILQDEAEKNGKSKDLSFVKKSAKVAFCPEEVGGILDSSVLALKNAQSHTMRKIIVFASLGIRHGCEEMYDLDYSHFSVVQKGEPYISSNGPVEHVLYENPGLKKKKVFYPNRNNPTLCPVQILEEEKTMRPSDATCPSCLFLCIKYGGKTRNVPQNQYVRQRMGRNKLKSFGPLICQMAWLVNVRSGSFFFKSLGITLLFMAGFPNDIVQRETKYRNFDLLQKYYRTDEDAAGEELFHTNDSCFDLVSSVYRKPNSKTTTKPRGKRQTNSVNDTQENPIQEIPATSDAPTPQFGLVGYSSNQNSFKAVTNNNPFTPVQPSNPTFSNFRPNIPYHPHNLYPIFPPHPPNAMFPLMYWPSPHVYATWPPYHPSSYGYRGSSGTIGGHYTSIQPQSYYGHGLAGNGTCNVLDAKPEEESRNKTDHHAEDATISGSESSSSSMDPKKL